MMGQALTYIEIDIDYCSRTYGTAPCTASLGVTGDKKCFNTARTCQDRANFNNVPVTLRFAVDCDYLPRDIDVVSASVVSVNFTPARISLGEDLGLRASLMASFKDHRSGDAGTGFDKYVTDRDYNPFEQGSFWGKFRARNPFLRGRPLRWIMGFVGQDLADMETRNFVIDSFSGPTPAGTFTITAKDVLKLADNDRAQAPALSQGSLLSTITSSATSLTVTPSGIGSEYPSSGWIAVGGKEVMSYTRSGDVFTVTRGLFNTTAIAHNAEDLVQLCLRYGGVDPAYVMQDLLENYAGVDSAYIPIADWVDESANYLGRVVTTIICQPTGVNQLLTELIQQTASAMWWDDINQTIRWQVLRTISTEADVYDESNMLAGSLTSAEQPDTRISQCYVFYGQRNPLEPLDNETNYRSGVLKVAAQEESDYGSPAIRKIYSRWIPQFGTSFAQRIANIYLGRYKNPPRTFTFDVFRRQDGMTPLLGNGYNIEAWSLQEDDGSAETVPIQVTRLKPTNEKLSIESQEAIFVDDGVIDPSNRVITIDSDTNNFNLRGVHDSLFPAIVDPTGITLTCVINAGVKVGSALHKPYTAFEVGNWPVGLSITIINRGRIEGAGGNGGHYYLVAGQDGGDAFYTRYPVSLNNSSGEIWGGGGGGASDGYVGAGGGAGSIPGSGGVSYGSASNGTSGTATAGGVSGTAPNPAFYGGAGGSPGQDGTVPFGSIGYGTATTGPSGTKGKAIDGWSYVTNLGTGSVLGPVVN